MKKIVFIFLYMTVLGISSCMKDGGNIQNYTMLGIVEMDFTYSQPKIVTSSEDVLVPELTDHLNDKVFEGDAVLANFTVDYDNQPYPEAIVATELSLKIIDKSYPLPAIEEDNGSNESAISIKYIEIDRVGNFLFFNFGHTAPKDQTFDYEMTYKTDEISTIYIKAKIKKAGSESLADFLYLYAFNMSSYLRLLEPDSENAVTFNIKVFDGVDEEGNNVYVNWSGNPIRLSL